MSATPRGIHLVGSYPAVDDRSAMSEMLKVAGPMLRSLPSGETQRPRETVDDVHRLTYHQQAVETWPVFDQLRQEAGLPLLRYQVGLPSPVEVPVVGYLNSGPAGPVRALRAVPDFRSAYLREVEKIWADDRIAGADKPANLTFQLELPVMVAAIERMPRVLQTELCLPIRLLMGELLARSLAKQVEGLPPRAEVVLHVCTGNRAVSRPRNLANIVMLLRKIIEHWPAGRTLAGIHLPFASAGRRPSADPAYYWALGALGPVLPKGCRIAAGFVHEGESLDDQRRVQELIDASLNRRVTVGPADVAYFCGYGRLTNSTLARVMLERAVTLASG